VDKVFSGWVLYDETCGFCRNWVPFWKTTLKKRGFEIAPLQSGWVQEELKLSPAELNEDLRLLLPDGKQIQGADVYRYVMRRIGWAFPIYLISVTPVFRKIFNWGYRTFAQRRFKFSRACGLRNGFH